MSQSLADILLHIVFSTKSREPWIDPEIEPELFAYIHGITNNLQCPIVRINGTQDHVHILLHLNKRITVSDLISKLKSNSSKWIKTKDKKYLTFYWQAGYGVFSVSRPGVEAAIKYIDAQKEHHKTKSFKEEFLDLLRRAGLSYDEKYLWD